MTRLPLGFTLLQIVPGLDAGGVEQTAVDIAAAVVAAGGRSIVASEGGRLKQGLAGQHVRLPVASKNPLVVMRNGFRLRRLIEREQVSLVHVRSRAPAFSALWAARRAGVPVVATYAGIHRAQSRLKRWYNGVMTRGDLVIANSNFTARHLAGEHPASKARLEIIPRGVDLIRFDPDAVTDERVAALRRAWGLPEKDSRKLVLLAGRLTRWKGQALIVEVAGLLAAEGRRDFVIVLAGDDQGRRGYRHQLEERIVELGLGDQVLIVGHCADMPTAYAAADLAVAPSLQPEAFGRTAVEPQIMGKPVLAADHGGARETVVDGKTGWLVKPADAGAWGEALSAALDIEPERLAAMGAAGRRRAVALYAVETMTEATLEAYIRLLEQGQR